MRRVLVILTMVGAVLALGLPAAGVDAGTASAASAPDAGRPGCAERAGPTAGSARVTDDATVADPSALTRAESRAMERAFRARLAAMSPAERRAARRGAEPVEVALVWQVIVRDDGSGGPTNRQVERQLTVLNRGFAGSTSPDAAETRFSFVTQEIVRTRNSDWYRWGEDDDGPAKRALRQGGKATLNIYVTRLSDGLLGYATYPGGDLTSDGVVLLNESLPGGDAAPFNRGDTATHEVGHWLGLAHTFDNGCRRPGDRVADTPAQADGDNVGECDPSLDTCNQPGTDPVRNFMNYTDDLCIDQFTPGQATRMSEQWDAFRARRS